MKKVLIITYYWPPTGGAGVQRWLKFVKYLPEFGWTPYVCTPENPSFINLDETLIKEVPKDTNVLKIPIWEPYNLFGKLKGKNEIHEKELDIVKTKSITNKMALWVRGNIFIPDPRKFWVRPVVKRLKAYIKEEKIDALITTGPPHSIHLIGWRLKKATGINWLADFRDPWTEWDILDSFYMTPLARWYNRYLEKKVLTNADSVVAIGNIFAGYLERLGAKNAQVITNGFDPSDFTLPSEHKKSPTDIFTIRHIGTIDEFRDPTPFLKAVSEIIREGKIKADTVRVEFYGNVKNNLVHEVAGDPMLSGVVHFKGYVPHHEVFPLYQSSDVLLLVLAHTHNAQHNIPGKLFEYLASGAAVFGIGDPEGETSKILRETGRGTVKSWKDIDGAKQWLLENLTNKKDKKNDLGQIKSYSRKNLTEKLASVLNSL